MKQCLIVRLLIVCLALLAFSASGCGSQNSEQLATEPGQDKNEIVTPEQVLAAFLDAARNGDKEASRQWLTAKTLAECAKHDLEVNPPGTPSMSYKIGEVGDAPQFAGGIFVESTWSEELPDGPIEMDVLWAMRKDKGQWRICGMVMQFEEDAEPVLFDFENGAAKVAAMIHGSAPPEDATGDDQSASPPVAAKVVRQPEPGQLIR